MRTESSEDILNTLKKKPTYTVLIRPIGFRERIESVHEARRIVEASYVSLRGWDFPFLNSHEEAWELAENYVSSWVLFNQHAEIWRFYLSGQFAYSGMIREQDSQYQDSIRAHTLGTHSKDMMLDIGNVLWCFTEFWDFASRLAQKTNLVNGLELSVNVNGIKGWRLGTSTSDRMFTQSQQCHTDTILIEEKLSYADLLTHKLHSRKALQKLLSHFDKRIDENNLDLMQDELYKLGYGKNRRGS